MIKQTDIKLFEMTFGDLSPLTPMQRIDLMEWYFGGNNSKRAVENDVCGGAELGGSRDDVLSDKLLRILKRCRTATVAFAKNRTKNKYSEKEIIDAFSRLESKGLVVRGKTKIGKYSYSIA